MTARISCASVRSARLAYLCMDRRRIGQGNHATGAYVERASIYPNDRLQTMEFKSDGRRKRIASCLQLNAVEC